MSEIHEWRVAELARQLQAKAVSSVEVTQHLLARAEAHQGLGSFLHLDPDRALAQAKIADTQRSDGHAAPLLGVPMAHKDVFVTEGMPTTAGSKMLAGYQSPFTATVVRRLTEAGTVSLGKLNCDEFAMGSANENSAYGVVKNPWDVTRVPGGSSGGSAAAVAARLVPAATGTDTGGSIRQPAAFCGITGIKPTYGLCSRYGMVAFASSLDQAGPMARSAEDCALLLSAMAGPDLDRDATSLDVPARDFTNTLNHPRAGATPDKPLSGLRVGLPEEFFGAGVSTDVNDAVQAALAQLTALGATLVSDLDQRGLLDNVLVIAMGEFGRTPSMGTQGSTDGRNHWPEVMSMCLAGGGLNHGQVIGATEADGGTIRERPVTPADLAATLFRYFDVPLDVQYEDHQGRPRYVVDGGVPIRELFQKL